MTPLIPQTETVGIRRLAFMINLRGLPAHEVRGWLAVAGDPLCGLLTPQEAWDMKRLAPEVRS